MYSTTTNTQKAGPELILVNKEEQGKTETETKKSIDKGKQQS